MAFPHYGWNGEELPPLKLKRLKRATAERMVSELIDRAAAYNADSSRLLTITRIAVFGSYLTEAPTLGDIDISIAYVRKPEWSTDAVRHLAQMERPGLDYIRHITWDRTDLYKNPQPKRIHLAAWHRGFSIS